MSLADEIKNYENAEQARGSNEDVDYPSSHLKGQILSVRKKNPKVTVRILPAVSPDKPTWAAFRTLWVTDANGKSHSYVCSEDTHSEDDPLIQALNRWGNAKIPYRDAKTGENKEHSGLYAVDTKYGRYPAKKYYVNAVELEVTENADGVPIYKEKYTPEGKLDVRLLTLNNTMLSALISNLGNPMNNPNKTHMQFINKWVKEGRLQFKDNAELQEQIDASFISDLFAYPITFSLIEANGKYTSQVDIDQQDAHLLKPLPRDWRDQAEDLQYQATPSYKYNSHWTNALIDEIDAKLGTASHIEAPKQKVEDPFPTNDAYQAPNNTTTQNVQMPPAPQTQKVSVPTDNGINVAGKTVEDPFANMTTPIQPTQPANPETQTADIDKVIGGDMFKDMPDLNDIPSDDVPTAESKATPTPTDTTDELDDILGDLDLGQDADDLLKN